MSPRRPALTLASASANAVVASLSRADGERLLERGGLAALRAALQPASATDTAAGRATPDGSDGWMLFWLGFVSQFDDLVLARAHWSAAEGYFARQGDARGMCLASCG